MVRTFPLLFALFAPVSLLAGGYKQDAVADLPLTGVVEFVRPADRYFFLTDVAGSGTWRVEVGEPDALKQVRIGACIVITNGETRAQSTTRRINRAEFKVVGEGRVSVPRKVSLEELYRHPLNDPAAEDLWARIVTCEGTVRDINRRQTFTQLQVGEGSLSFQAAVRADINTPLPEDLRLGARVAVTGVMLYTPIDDPVRHVMTDFSDVSVMPTGPEGVEILSRAPFWTPGRIWAVVGGVALLLLLVGLILMLVAVRLRLTMREKELEKHEFEAIRRERLRLSYELHDDFQQLLASCQFKLEAGAEWLGRDDAKAREQIEKVQRWLVMSQDLLRKRLWGMNEDLAAMEGQGKEGRT